MVASCSFDIQTSGYELSVQTFRVLYSYWKPESARTHPEATVRPWATVQVVGDALGFSSALGYM
jgi:hypothetical protein